MSFSIEKGACVGLVRESGCASLFPLIRAGRDAA
jgi:hypothetical protein